MSKDWTDEEVERAAECLYGSRHPLGSMDMGGGLRAWWMESARRALDHGYRPPPKPRSVRDDLKTVLVQEAWMSLDGAVDAILARFDVKPKEGGDA